MGMNSYEINYFRFISDAQRLNPALRIEYKASRWYWRALGRALTIVSFGAIRNFTTDYVTTLGNRIGVPAGFDSWAPRDKHRILIPELVHVEQQWRGGFGLMPLGVAVFAFLYLLAPLPIGLAWFRYRFERAAYAAELRFSYRGGVEEHAAKRDVERVAGYLSGRAYFWAWPFRSAIVRWLSRRLS